MSLPVIILGVGAGLAAVLFGTTLYYQRVENQHRAKNKLNQPSQGNLNLPSQGGSRTKRLQTKSRLQKVKTKKTQHLRFR
jgi:hypothetical protein